MADRHMGRVRQAPPRPTSRRPKNQGSARFGRESFQVVSILVLECLMIRIMFCISFQEFLERSLCSGLTSLEYVWLFHLGCDFGLTETA